ncbi:Hypothetical predicted protein [Lecanosticta acicola]|uniref:Mob1/phocein n=1 Tax=Lecanosticta acicola TaxID=111012 RepID=A0AAI8YZL7_9PEZI|nr:Hypothetical predicted protein [Lecanosticta acicola]
MAAASSPSSSPRLPSPPPIAEDQIGPTSPGISGFEDHHGLAGISNIDMRASRRIRPGTKAIDMAEGPPLVEMQEIDSAFQLTEHLKALHYSHTHPADSNQVKAITADLANELAITPPNTSREIWLYELGRFLIQKTNAIIVALFADHPPCSQQTCPEMRASEWQYLCAVHDPPKSCSAIDYCCHTLDWAASSLTSSKMFPSRLGLGSGNAGGGSDKFLQQQMKEITNIFRRVYRIYAHAWFQHREVFYAVESKTGLYTFFKTVCDEYNLIQPENYTIPPEAAEGQAPVEKEDQAKEKQDRPRPTSILPRPSEPGPQKAVDQEPAGNDVKALNNTTKRHTRAPSSMSEAVTTVIEEVEEDEDGDQAKPGLGRSSTALHESEQTQSAHSPPELKEEDPPLAGVSRIDTLKPGKEHDESVSGTDGTTEMKPEDTDVDAILEAIEPTEPPAAAAEEEAGKTAAD